MLPPETITLRVSSPASHFSGRVADLPPVGHLAIDPVYALIKRTVIVVPLPGAAFTTCQI